MDDGVLLWLIILTVFATLLLLLSCWLCCSRVPELEHPYCVVRMNGHYDRIKNLEQQVNTLSPFPRECTSLKDKIDDLSVKLNQISADFESQEGVVTISNAKYISLENDVSELTRELERFSSDMRDLTNTIAANNYEMMVIHPSVDDYA